MIKTKYKIRAAKSDDKQKVQQLFVQSIAHEKNILSPALIQPAYVEDFVNKIIEQGNMILVENASNELELIGQVHYYHPYSSNNDAFLKEMIFLSRMESENAGRATELVEWLYGEIEKKYKDVFCVEVSTPVDSLTSVSHFLNKGIKIEGNYRGRLKSLHNGQKTILPLSWINPSFN